MIDIQNGMFGPDAVCHEPDQMLANVALLLERARGAGIPVIFVQHCDTEGPLTHKSDGWQIHPSVVPKAEPVIEKRACSSFYNTDLDSRLRAMGVERLVIAGLQTEFCIDTACRVAQTLGYEVTLAADAHSTFDTETLSAEQIIAHHNQTLSGIVTRVTPAAEIRF